jgi:hypothetical protein
MFTIKGSCDPSAAAQLASVLAKELKDCADKVDAAQLDRARNATASIVLINNEHGAINAEDMGRQVKFFCRRFKARKRLVFQRVMSSEPPRFSGYVHWCPRAARAAAGAGQRSDRRRHPVRDAFASTVALL